MAADSNIFAQYLRPAKSMQDYGNDMDAAEQNRLTLQSGRMKAQQDQLAVEDDNALRSAYQQSGGDNNALLKILQGGGRYKAAEAVQKRIQEQLKGKSELDTADVNRRKSETEIIDKSLGTAKTFVNQIQDANGAAAYLNGLYSNPVLGPLAQRLMPKDQAIAQIPQDPEGLLKWKAGHMAITGDKLIELLRPKTDITNMGANQSFGSTDQFTGQRTQTGSAPILQSANNAATIAAQADQGDKTRAQALKVAGMVDSRSRDATESARDLARERLDFDKTEATRKTSIDGAEKPLNEGQSKALLFGSRMKEADAIIGKLAKDGVNQPGVIKRSAETVGNIVGLGTSFGDVLGDTAGSLTNWTQSDGQQLVEQAQRDFINATLRRESGASIANTEFSNGKKQYFPQPGDSDSVLQQKARNRATAIAGILAEVPQNRRDLKVPEPQNGGASGGWSITKVPK